MVVKPAVAGQPLYAPLYARMADLLAANQAPADSIQSGIACLLGGYLVEPRSFSEAEAEMMKG